jgi:hypothetical protein
MCTPHCVKLYKLEIGTGKKKKDQNWNRTVKRKRAPEEEVSQYNFLKGPFTCLPPAAKQHSGTYRNSSTSGHLLLYTLYPPYTAHFLTHSPTAALQVFPHFSFMFLPPAYYSPKLHTSHATSHPELPSFPTARLSINSFFHKILFYSFALGFENLHIHTHIPKRALHLPSSGCKT